MKKIYTVIILLLVILFLSSCFATRKEDEQVKDEIIEYYTNAYETFENMKHGDLKTLFYEFASYTKTLDIESMEKMLREKYLPKIDEVIEHLEGIQLKAEEMEALNNMYIKAEQLYYEGMEYYADGLREFPVDELDQLDEQVDRYIAEYEGMYEEIEETRDELLKKYNLELVVDYDVGGEVKVELKDSEDK